MKTRLIFLFCFFSIPMLSFSQYPQDFQNNAINQLLNEHYFKVINTTKTSFDYKGSPYENDTFIKGSLYTSTKQLYTDVPLRFNIYNDNIEFKSEDKTLALENPNLFEFITIGQSKYVYLPYSVSKITKKGFFKVVEEGNATLLVKPKVVLYEAIRPGPYQDAVPATFSRTGDEIYIQIGIHEPQLVANKKSLEEIFSDKKDRIAGFLKGNKIKVSSVDSVLKVVKFYNSN